MWPSASSQAWPGARRSSPRSGTTSSATGPRTSSSGSGSRSRPCSGTSRNAGRIVFVDEEDERTITLIGDKLRPRIDEALPWDELADFDAPLLHGRRTRTSSRQRGEAKVLVATARELETLKTARTSGWTRWSRARATLRSSTRASSIPSLISSSERDGSEGRQLRARRRQLEVGRALPAPAVDSYGAGDSFAAGLTVRAGRRAEPFRRRARSRRALRRRALTRRGAHGRREPAAEL